MDFTDSSDRDADDVEYDDDDAGPEGPDREGDRGDDGGVQDMSMASDVDAGTPLRATAARAAKGQKSARRRYSVIENTELLPARVKLVLSKLIEFYKNGCFEQVVLPIVERQDPIALRDLDWACVSYSAVYPVVYR